MNMEHVYLDNAATTFCLKKVSERIMELFSMPHGNPSALHTLGFKSSKLLKESREFFSSHFRIKPEQIIFTSSGTEANNFAISGILEKESKRKTLVTTPIEHPSVARVMEHWQTKGFNLSFVQVDASGLVDLNDLAQKITPDVALVSVMAVNNEIGTIEPIQEIGKIIHQKSPETIFHVDSVQAFGKIPLEFDKWRIDLMSMSSHKIHGMIGSGALLMSTRIKLHPLLLGGGQEFGLRSGTENILAISAFKYAAEEILKNQGQAFERIQTLKQKLKEGIQKINPSVKVNTPDKNSPYVLNISFPGFGSELLMRFLEEKNIYVSAGSSCNSKKKKPSSVLKAMGCSEEEINSAIRFSFSPLTTEQEINYTLDVLPQILERLRGVKSL